MKLPEPNLARYSREQLQFATAAWPMRAAEERRSALSFGALALAARRAGWPQRFVTRFASAARDEVRHTRLCTQVGMTLGASPPQYDLVPVHQRLAALPSPLQRATALLLVEVALGETISTAFFAVGAATAVEPLTKTALGMIAADERRHAQLGWDASFALWPTLAEAHRDSLQQEVRSGLVALERQTAIPALRRLQAGDRFDPAWAELGVLDPELRVDAFYGAVCSTVLPTLNRLGLDGTRAWSERYATPSVGPIPAPRSPWPPRAR